MCQNRKTHNKIMAVNMAHTLGLRGGDSRFILTNYEHITNN